MAGHSQFKNIMYRKGAQDAKRAKVFTKLIRELTVATRSGLPDPALNPRLRTAVLAAKAANMPKDTVDRAIKRGSGDAEGENFEEVRYEGYGPGGVAIIIEALTDNRNRTAAEVRAAFTRCDGALGETGGVTFQFDRVGSVTYPAEAVTDDQILEAAVEAGADDCESTPLGHEVVCAPDQLGEVRDSLETRFGQCQSATLVWRPKTTTPVSEDQASTLFKLIEMLEDNDDVQSVSANYDVPDDVMARLSA